MVEASSSSSTHGSISPQNALKLVKYHLENARKTTDPDLIEIIYNESRAALSRMEHPTLEALLNPDYSQDLRLKQEVTSVLAELDDMLVSLRQVCVTQENQTESEDLSNTRADSDSDSSKNGIVTDTAVIPRQIFAVN
ncbi:hypothetical protein B0O80DRAFT_487614, partial [Mortierella sp. GBAus27b]